jgi:hypothetical protein
MATAESHPAAVKFMTEVTLHVNGEAHTLTLENRTTLLDALTKVDLAVDMVSMLLRDLAGGL